MTSLGIAKRRVMHMGRLKITQIASAVWGSIYWANKMVCEKCHYLERFKEPIPQGIGQCNFAMYVEHWGCYVNETMRYPKGCPYLFEAMMERQENCVMGGYDRS
jgi:hypothetical protein